MKKSKKIKQAKFKFDLRMPMNASRFLASQTLKLLTQSLDLMQQASKRSLSVVKSLPNVPVNASRSVMSQIDSNFMVVIMVAIVAIAGLALCFNQTGATGAALSKIKGEGYDTPPKLLGDDGNFVFQGRMIFDECHLNPDKMTENFKKVAPDDPYSADKCCAFSCRDFCLGKDENCGRLCRVGCETESKVLFKLTK